MISIVIPVHNEADEIGGLLEALSAFAGVELIVAEDASTDGTPDIVREFASRNDKVVLTSSRTLASKGAAVRRGLALAKGNVLGFIDGDGSVLIMSTSSLMHYIVARCSQTKPVFPSLQIRYPSYVRQEVPLQ